MNIIRDSSGFTLIELIVVIAIISMLAGTVVPLATAAQKAQKLADVEEELNTIGEALEAYYYENGQFPASLSAAGFKGKYILSGVNDDGLKDEWGSKAYYLTSVSSNPDIMTAYSVGENGVDNGAGNEEFKIIVYGAKSGNERTRLKLRVIAAVLSDFLDGGGSLTGTWSVDRAAMGLGIQYQTDGFGQDLQSDSSAMIIKSSGADRSFGTSDDIYF